MEKYRSFLCDMDVEEPVDLYKTGRLETKITNHFGKVTLFPQTNGSPFLCPADIKIGDALAKLQKLQKEINNQNVTFLNATTLMRQDALECKKNQKDEEITILHAGALDMIPSSIYNFCCSILDSKVGEPPEGAEMVVVDKNIEEQALIMAQQMLHHVTPMNTPLSVGTAYYLYNQTRCKALVTLNNKLHVGISYDTLHRQLTSQCEEIMMEIEETGVYIPQNITPNTRYPPVFPIENLDWFKKTLEGGSFNATTYMIIQNIDEEDYIAGNVSYKLYAGSSKAHRTPSTKTTANRSTFYVSSSERKKSKSLGDITSMEDLNTDGDGSADDLLLMWQLGRLQTSQVWDTEIDQSQVALPNFNAFCARMSKKKLASHLGYLPLTPASPTNPAVLKNVMEIIVKTNNALGHEWTIIAGDQATYELASAIRKIEPAFNNVVLLLGGFHLAFNYLRAICKIVRDVGGEKLLTIAGMFKEGTAKKAFGEKAQYYQTLYAVTTLS